MGSFNITCCVTGLPIRWNEDIVAIPLIKNITNLEDIDYEEMPVWSHYFYTICGLPIYGKYDDYGMIQYDSNNTNVKIYEKIADQDNYCKIWSEEVSLMVMHKAAYEYLISWKWIDVTEETFIFDRILKRGKEEICKSIENIKNGDNSFVYIRDYNKGICSYYYSNPFYNLIDVIDEKYTKYGLNVDWSDVIFDIEYFYSILPVVEASTILNFKLEPPMYENQTANLLSIIKCKNEIFEKVLQDVKKYHDYEEE